MTNGRSLTPEEEREVCRCISVNYSNLRTFTEAFELAVQLFELLERGGGPPSVGVFGGVFIQYRIIAAKEGAMNIYHFGCSLEAIRRQIVLCSETRGIVNTEILKKSSALFNKYFPHANNTRHAIAHAGELWGSAAKLREHRQREDYVSTGGSSAAGGYLSAMLYERTYSVGWEGKVFEVNMTNEAYDKLAEVMRLAQSAF